MPRTPAGAGTSSQNERVLQIVVDDRATVSAILVRPPSPRAVLALAHGAGAGMKHPFMEALARRLAARDVATLRYQFPYMETGGGRPGPPGRLVATVQAAVATAGRELPDLSLFAGGKSLGGRMTSTAAAQGAIPKVRGIVFFGFPLHPPGQAGTGRSEHLSQVECPMLFLQGTRDAFADLERLRPVCAKLGDRAELHVIESADHSFHVLKRSGRDDEQTLDELADRTASWMRGLIADA